MKTIGDLILEGSKLTGPLKHRLVEVAEITGAICTCALGAAGYACLRTGYITLSETLDAIRKETGLNLMETWLEVPENMRFMVRNGETRIRVYQAIVVLNDMVGWSREQIGNWLNTLTVEIEK